MDTPLSDSFSGGLKSDDSPAYAISVWREFARSLEREKNHYKEALTVIATDCGNPRMDYQAYADEILNEPIDRP